jgi:hypothetical protein
MEKAEKNTIVVFTARSPKRIVDEGGSQAWVLNPARAKLADWLVCTQNRHHRDHEFSDATEPHGSAMLVCKISGVRRSSEEDCEDRWLVEISQYAYVSIPNVWKHWRNPVRYMSLDDLGIDVTTLPFEMMREKAAESERIIAPMNLAPAGLTIPDAKKALAITFGVSPDAVEITIRG